MWAPFAKDGRLANSDTSWVSDSEKLARRHCVRFTLQPGEKKIIPMVISWDLPVVQFGQGRKWNRRYTDFYGTTGKMPGRLPATACCMPPSGATRSIAWQAPYINDESKPLWYRGMLFNELYILADGGTFWGRQVGSDQNPPSFALLECFDYAYYATLDVRFYASLPLLKFWPDIDKQVLRSLRIPFRRSGRRRACGFGKLSRQGSRFCTNEKRRAPCLTTGVPEGDPFIAVNQPGWQDTNDWKDLNSKFVLMVYRDYVFTGGRTQRFCARRGRP